MQDNFLCLHDYKTKEPIFVDFNQIAFIQQLPENGKTPKRTRIDLTCSPQIFLVNENAKDIALSIRLTIARLAENNNTDKP
jgi:hypothetical protein